MELNTGNQKFINIIIEFSKDFPFTINPGTDKELTYPSLIEMINPDDIPPITEMFTDITIGGEKKLEAHCRFLVAGEYHWFFLSCEPVYGSFTKPMRFEGTMCDVSTYLEATGEDLVYKEYRKKHNIKLAELRKGSISLDEVLDKEYLVSIQKPFAQPQLYSGIFDAHSKLICVPKGQNPVLRAEDFPFQKKKNIRINHLVSGCWTIAAKSEKQLDEQLQLFDTLVQTISRMANAFVAVLNEMDNAQNANKLLSQNVEEQILLNNVYDIIMKTRTVQDGLELVLELVGGYFKLDRIAIIDNDSTTRDRFSWYSDKRFAIDLPDEQRYKLTEKNFPDMYSDIRNTSSSFSENGRNDLAFMGVKSYAAYKLYDSGSFGGMIAYETIDNERTWTQRERKQLRNISQIISSILMRKRTQEKLEESQQRMRQLAFYDSIFQVPNRARLNKDLTELLENGEEGSIVAFKITNTRSLSAVNGHSYSDMLVKSVAQYLVSLPVKNLGVYYFTNAIFMLNLPGCMGNEAKKLAEMLIYRFSKPWIYDGSEHHIYCSLGIAYYPVNGKTAEDVCKAASVAMYRAREFKRNSYTFYSGSLEKTRSLAATLENRIMYSLKNGMKGFSLRYQPAFSSEDGSVSYCEALIRWNDEKYGNIPNSTLFPLAENLGISGMIDKWVLEQSCKFCKAVQDGGLEDFRVSINLTAGELQSSEIIHQVQYALEASGLSAQSLILEIPVKANLSYSDSMNILTELKNTGVNISIDSYGTEDISLKMLKNAYVSIINIPKGLLTRTEDEFDRELINAIITLAHCKNINICVKGIEDEEQLQAARSHNVDWVQGYYCSRPMSAKEAEQILLSRVNS